MVTTPTPSTPNSIGLTTPNELTTKLSSDSNTSTSGNNYTFQFDGLNKTTPISTPKQIYRIIIIIIIIMECQ